MAGGDTAARERPLLPMGVERGTSGWGRAHRLGEGTRGGRCVPGRLPGGWRGGSRPQLAVAGPLFSPPNPADVWAGGVRLSLFRPYSCPLAWQCVPEQVPAGAGPSGCPMILKGEMLKRKNYRFNKCLPL